MYQMAISIKGFSSIFCLELLVQQFKNALKFKIIIIIQRRDQLLIISGAKIV